MSGNLGEDGEAFGHAVQNKAGAMAVATGDAVAGIVAATVLGLYYGLRDHFKESYAKRVNRAMAKDAPSLEMMRRITERPTTLQMKSLHVCTTMLLVLAFLMGFAALSGGEPLLAFTGPVRAGQHGAFLCTPDASRSTTIISSRMVTVVGAGVYGKLMPCAEPDSKADQGVLSSFGSSLDWVPFMLSVGLFLLMIRWYYKRADGLEWWTGGLARGFKAMTADPNHTRHEWVANEALKIGALLRAIRGAACWMMMPALFAIIIISLPIPFTSSYPSTFGANVNAPGVAWLQGAVLLVCFVTSFALMFSVHWLGGVAETFSKNLARVRENLLPWRIRVMFSALRSETAVAANAFTLCMAVLAGAWVLYGMLAHIKHVIGGHITLSGYTVIAEAAAAGAFLVVFLIHIWLVRDSGGGNTPIATANPEGKLLEAGVRTYRDSLLLSVFLITTLGVLAPPVAFIAGPALLFYVLAQSSLRIAPPWWYQKRRGLRGFTGVLASLGSAALGAAMIAIALVSHIGHGAQLSLLFSGIAWMGTAPYALRVTLIGDLILLAFGTAWLFASLAHAVRTWHWAAVWREPTGAQ